MDKKVENKSLIRQEDLVLALKTVYDPEIPVDIYELGLIYDISSNGNKVNIRMTLTAPACPVAEEMPKWVEVAVLDVEGVKDVIVEMVFDPPWSSEMISEDGKAQLGMDD